MKRRVAVTGIGVVSALGIGREVHWAALRAGRGGIAALNIEGLRMSAAAALRGFDPLAHFSEKELDLIERFSQFAIVAAREAVADAGVTPPAGAAIVMGSCGGGRATEDRGYKEIYGEKKTRLNPFTIPRTMENARASQLSMAFGIHGPVWTVSTACSSSNHALGQAYWLVRHGITEMALAGGTEAPLCFGFLKAWEAMRVAAPDTCRPFSLERKGLVLGEGAAVLVLEPLDAAQARGARIYGEVVGFGMSADGGHITQPSAEGAAAAMRAALEDAGIDGAAIGYVNAHGTGTPLNDATECRAIRAVLGDRLLVSSTKSMHGHTLGAAGALEAAATLMALRDQFVPPTANFLTADPECDLDVVPNAGRAAAIEYALSNSFAFGGLNAVLAFRAVSPRSTPARPTAR